MECVQLVVPQHLYDELGLQPNQTVTLSRSQSAGDTLTQDANVNPIINSGDACSQTQDSVRTESEGSKTAVEETKPSSLEKEFIAVVVNEGNGKQRLLTYQLISSTILANSKSEADSSESESEITSNNSDDVHSQTDKLHALQGNDESCDASVQEEPIYDKTGKKRIILSPSKSHAVFQGKSVNASFALPAKVKYFNPKFCETCSRGYLSKTSFRNHKKHCADFVKNVKVKVEYPRRCTNCERTYEDSAAFWRHKANCEKFKIKQAEKRSRGEIVGKIKYPWYCTLCNFKCKDGHAYRNHRKRCNENTYVKKEVDSYPKTCVTCNRIYFSPSLYLKHKRFCDFFARKQASTQSLESTSQLSSLESFSEELASESNISSNTICDTDELDKVSPPVTDVEKPGKWVSFSTERRNSQKYFVIKKNSSLQKMHSNFK